MTRIGVLVGILAMAGMTETGFAGSVKPVDGAKVRVCLGDTPQRQMIALAWAKAQASKMFSTAGVTIDWRSTSACPADGIRIQFSQATKPEDHPGDSAYAMPYEGTTIVVFYDRLLPRIPSVLSTFTIVPPLLLCNRLGCHVPRIAAFIGRPTSGHSALLIRRATGSRRYW